MLPSPAVPPPSEADDTLEDTALLPVRQDELALSDKRIEMEDSKEVSVVPDMLLAQSDSLTLLLTRVVDSPRSPGTRSREHGVLS